MCFRVSTASKVYEESYVYLRESVMQFFLKRTINNFHQIFKVPVTEIDLFIWWIFKEFNFKSEKKIIMTFYEINRLLDINCYEYDAG